MVNAKNAVYREIEMNWGEITLPLKAGTPVGLNGQIANDSDAVGIVPQTVSVLPVVKSIRILVGGSVSLAEVNAAYGSALTKAAKESMSGIAFYGEDGTPEPNPLWDGEPVPGTLPAVESTDAGKILTVDDDGNWVAASGGGVLIIGMTAEAGTLTLDKTWQEIYDHMSAGGQAMVFTVSTLADEPFVQQVIVSSCEGIPSDSEYYVNFSDTTFPQFSATSPSGYPSASL